VVCMSGHVRKLLRPVLSCLVLLTPSGTRAEVGVQASCASEASFMANDETHEKQPFLGAFLGPIIAANAVTLALEPKPSARGQAAPAQRQQAHRRLRASCVLAGARDSAEPLKCFQVRARGGAKRRRLSPAKVTKGEAIGDRHFEMRAENAQRLKTRQLYSIMQGHCRVQGVCGALFLLGSRAPQTE
jgi:hypothetical protein